MTSDGGPGHVNLVIFTLPQEGQDNYRYDQMTLWFLKAGAPLSETHAFVILNTGSLVGQKNSQFTAPLLLCQNLNDPQPLPLFAANSKVGCTLAHGIDINSVVGAMARGHKGVRSHFTLAMDAFYHSRRAHFHFMSKGHHTFATPQHSGTWSCRNKYHPQSA